MDTIELRRIAALEDGSWWYRERRAIVARQARRLGPPGHAIDIGAACGGNGRVLADRGWTVVAVDLSETAVELARSRGLDAHRCDARRLPFQDGDFDLALAFDVLAHIDDDRAAAAELARVLRPGGTALISVPCDLALWSATDVVLGHVRRYARPELDALLTGAGLLVDRIWSWNVLLRPWLKWSRHRSPGCALAEPGRFADLFLRAAVTAERALPVKDRPGATLFARARRPVEAPAGA